MNFDTTLQIRIKRGGLVGRKGKLRLSLERLKRGIFVDQNFEDETERSVSLEFFAGEEEPTITDIATEATERRVRRKSVFERICGALARWYGSTRGSC